MTESGERTFGAGGVYRWTCPVCGVSNQGLTLRKHPRESAVEALESHVRGAKGVEHGRANRVPERLDRETLESHVASVD